MSKILKFRNKTTQNAIKINELDIRCTTQLVVDINEYRFELDEEFPWINVFKNIEDVNYEFLTDIDILNKDYSCSVNTLEELKIVATNWYFNKVEVVKEI